VPDKFDPYREALVMEQSTMWPEEVDDFEPAERQKIEQELHAAPEQCADLAYIRTHTGFCRQVTVTEEDLTRLGYEFSE
jgi:hypothetical protein